MKINNISYKFTNSKELSVISQKFKKKYIRLSEPLKDELDLLSPKSVEQINNNNYKFCRTDSLSYEAILNKYHVSQKYHSNSSIIIKNQANKTFRKSTFHNKDSRNQSNQNSHSVSKPSLYIDTNRDDTIRVLLCDDESLITKTLSQFFSKMTDSFPTLKFQVFETANGFQCLNKFFDFYNSGKHIDILIIDETMPILKGSQVINIIKTIIKENNLKPVVIISYTSYNQPDKLDYIYSQGADYILNKPIKFEDFRDFLYKNIFTFGNEENLEA